jgi:glycosyltransferase involved in cell wall biosynthesis
VVTIMERRGQSRDAAERPLTIAMVGQKGFPALWGGVEFHVDRLARGLAAREHRVTVFTRPRYQREVAARGLPSPRDVRARLLLSVPTKHLDALTHTFASTFAARRGFDILHYHAIGPGSLLALARVLAPRSARILTVHALDWKRAKWGPLAQRLLRMGEGIAVRSAHGIIAVSQDLGEYLRDRYGAEAAVIPNGVRPVVLRRAGPYLSSLGLEAGRFVLFVGRLVPEKGVDCLIEAFRRVPGSWKLAIAGPAQETAYARTLEEAARNDKRVLLCGVVHGERLDELYSQAGAFVLPSMIEGFSLSLLEALSYGLPIVASCIPEVRSVVERFSSERAAYFAPGDAEDLAGKIRAVVEGGREGAKDAIRDAGSLPGMISWEEVAARTERLYRSVLGRRRPAI